jgi:hypothetical protein
MAKINVLHLLLLAVLASTVANAEAGGIRFARPAHGPQNDEAEAEVKDDRDLAAFQPKYPSGRGI